MTTETRAQITQRREEIQAELSRLNEQLEELNAMDPVRELAIAIHEATCIWNHTDGCGWFYEFSDGKANWSGHAHARYLKKAQNLMDKLPGHNIDSIIDIVAAVKGV